MSLHTHWRIRGTSYKTRRLTFCLIVIIQIRFEILCSQQAGLSNSLQKHTHRVWSTFRKHNHLTLLPQLENVNILVRNHLQATIYTSTLFKHINYKYLLSIYAQIYSENVHCHFRRGLKKKNVSLNYLYFFEFRNNFYEPAYMYILYILICV